MIKLKTNQYVIKNGQLLPKEKPNTIQATARVIPYQHTVRRIQPNSSQQYEQTIYEQRNQIQALKRQIFTNRSLSLNAGKELLSQRQNIEVSPFTLYQDPQRQQKNLKSGSKSLKPSFKNINLQIAPQKEWKKIDDQISFSLNSQTIDEAIVNNEQVKERQCLTQRQSKFGRRVRSRAQRFRSFSIQSSEIQTITISTQTQYEKYFFKSQCLTTEQSQLDCLTTQRSAYENSQADFDLKNKSNEEKQHLIDMLQSQIVQNEKYKQQYENKLCQKNQNVMEIKQSYDKKVKQLNETLKKQRKASLRVRTQLSKCQQEISEKDATILQLIEKLRFQLNEVSNLKTQNKQAIAKQAQKIFKKVKGKQKNMKFEQKQKNN